MQTLADHSLLYKYPDTFSDILLDGNSVVVLGIEEVRIWPNGYGYVLTRVPTDQSAVEKVLLDGQTRNYTQYGMVQVIP